MCFRRLASFDHCRLWNFHTWGWNRLWYSPRYDRSNRQLFIAEATRKVPRNRSTATEIRGRAHFVHRPAVWGPWYHSVSALFNAGKRDTSALTIRTTGCATNGHRWTNCSSGENGYLRSLLVFRDRSPRLWTLFTCNATDRGESEW